MFYRFRFDGYVGAILKHSGFDGDDALDFWPVGTTKKWVETGLKMKLKPVEAAGLAVAYIAYRRRHAGQLSRKAAQFIVLGVHEIAERHRARIEILDRIYLVAFCWVVGQPADTPFSEGHLLDLS